MYKIKASKSYRKEYKLCKKRGRDVSKLERIIEKLAAGEKLPDSCCDHALKGKYAGYRDCHVEPDWVLIYSLEKDQLILRLLHTGTHSDLL